MSGVALLTSCILFIVFIISSLFIQSNDCKETTDTHSQSHHQSQTRPPPNPINPEINKITDGLYLTNFKCAKDYDALKSLGVKQILTIGAELPRHGEPAFKVMHVKINDSADENIKKYFNSTFNFIKRGPTVVHCAAGVSRSATIVAAFLMRTYKMTADGALAHIWECRNVIKPNYGFRDQLNQFEKELATPSD